MCGRYTVFNEHEIAEIREIINQISRKYGSAAAVKTGEIYPSDIAPIVMLADGKVEVARGTWGFPNWQTGKRPIINARSETAHEKRMFSGPLQNSRCVIPSTGFYEWTHEGRKAVDKYLFRQPGSPMLYMAGFTGTFKEADADVERYVILTQKPNQSVAPFHDRMPVILQKDEIIRWLRDGAYVNTVFDREGPELLSVKAG